MSDISFDELHEFAHSLGLPRVAFQGDHYDIHEITRLAALRLGATAVTSREVVAALRRGGLRRGPSLIQRGLRGVGDLWAPSLTTDRLLLRQWTLDDLDRVAEFDHYDQGHVDRNATLLALRGFGEWAVTLRSANELIGSFGLVPAPEHILGYPGLTLSGQISTRFRGQGFASEASRSVINYGFSVLELTAIHALIPRADSSTYRLAATLGFAESPDTGTPPTLDTHVLRLPVDVWSQPSHTGPVIR